MNNTIRSARKEGRHDNDGAQTEVAVVMTELRATAVYPQTANCNTANNRGTKMTGRFSGRGASP